MRLLIVEDEISLAEALGELFTREGYLCDIVYDGQDGLDYALADIYDVILLDIMLPKKDGLSVLHALREGGIATPVLLLTAKSEVEDKIAGLDCGADDYLTKPFAIGELKARVRAMTRRQASYLGERLTFGDLILDQAAHELLCGGQSVKLGAKEYQIMALFLQQPRHIISKERFIEKIWGFESGAEYNNIEVYISFLRKKLALLDTRVKIATVRSVGYLLEEGL